MIEWNELRTDPRIRYAAKVTGCAVSACLLATVQLNGMSVPLNTALAAAVSPACGAAVLAGSAASYALTGLLQTQPALLCAVAVTAVLRWILGIQPGAKTAAMLAAGSNFISAVIFALAGLINGPGWIPWICGSILAGVLAYCIRQVLSPCQQRNFQNYATTCRKPLSPLHHNFCIVVLLDCCIFALILTTHNILSFLSFHALCLKSLLL